MYEPVACNDHVLLRPPEEGAEQRDDVPPDPVRTALYDSRIGGAQVGLGQFEAKHLMTLALANAGRLGKYGA